MLYKFMYKAYFIRSFKHARTKRSMNLDRRLNDLTADLVQFVYGSRSATHINSALSPVSAFKITSSRYA